MIIKDIEVTSIIIIVAIVISALFIINLIDKKHKLKAETKRKAFHMSMGVSMLLLPYLFKNVISVGVLGLLAITGMLLLKHTKLKEKLGKPLYSVERKSLGEFYFIISIFLIFWLSGQNKILYSIPILILTFADSVAALIGKSYAKKNLAEMNEDAKSIEGSFMFFITAFMIVLVPLLLYTNVGREEVLLISAIIGFNVALIEMISHSGDDNILIPMTTYTFLSTLMTQEVEILRINILVIGIIFVIVTIANRVKVWSKIALAETAVVGYLTTIFYGFYALFAPTMMFLTVMNLPRRSEKEKKLKYDSRIIETNIIIGITICILASITGMKKELFMLYSLVYSMHLVVNSCVRFKYYFNCNEPTALLNGYTKGLILIFLPSILIEYLVFGEVLETGIMLVMVGVLLASGLAILIQRHNKNEEEISVENGYIHMMIVLIGCLFVFLVQNIQVLIR